MLKGGCLNSMKFLLQSTLPEDWKLLNHSGAGIPELPQLVGGWKSLLKVSVSIGPFLTFFSHSSFLATVKGRILRTFGLSQCGGSCIIQMLHSSSSLLCNGPGFQKAINSPTCWSDGKLTATLLYPRNTPLFMKLWSILYSGLPLIPVLSLLTCLPMAPQVSP